MKKVLSILVTIILLMGCSDYSEEEQIKRHQTFIQNHTIMIEMEFNGNTHEFVWYASGYTAGLAHWPDCKYCNSKQ